MLSCVSLSPDRPQSYTHICSEKTQTQLNVKTLVRVGREWEAEEFAEGFSASQSLITLLIKVYWLIVAEIVFLYAACLSVLVLD